MSEALKYERVSSDRQSLENHVRLFEQCFPGSRIADYSYLDWLYRQNPDGEVVGFDAIDDGKLAATYVCTPLVLAIDGSPVKGLLSLNTATAPAYRGRGLFTGLASMTYDLAREAGFATVVGVANQNSIGGFSRKLGFQDVAGLNARVGLTTIAARDAAAETSARLRRIWSPEAFAWRIANPINPLSVHRASGGGLLVQGATQYAPIAVRTRIHSEGIAPPRATRPFWPPLSLSLGLAPDDAAAPSWSMSIPERLRPSPLRFIYLPLAAIPKQIDPRRVFWTFLDFDAY